MKTRPGHRKSRGRQEGARARVPLILSAAATVVALAACGGSKPAYCTDRTSLQNSVKGLTSVIADSGISGLKTQVKQIKSDAAALVSSAKGDFPNETSAISSSVSTLANSVAALPSNASTAQIATVTRNAGSVVSSVKSFTDASSSACS